MLKKIYLTLSVLLLSSASFITWAEEITARQVVEEFQNQLIDVMKHDLPKIARIVVGKQSEELTPEQQAKLEGVFSKLSVSAYAHNFKSYSGESFSFVSEEETGRGGVVIHTNLLIPGDKDVKFDYMMKKKDEGWQIINIIADGVSDLALKRSDYTSVLSREGFDALIAKINEKIESYSKQ
jgi:phospholipid transport system substrate-binding protein